MTRTNRLPNISTLPSRLPEQGRIRIGRFAGNRPAAIDTFRFTSSDRGALDELAALYGGEVTPWERAPQQGQFELTTDTATLPIALPPNPLGDTPIYEQWGAGGRQRSCDGETAWVPNGETEVETACLCNQTQQLVCKPTTRLVVVLREIRFNGAWMLKTGSWNAAYEMPAMVELISTLQTAGIVMAELAIDRRRVKKANEKFAREFVVPVLRPEVSLEALAAGEATLASLAPAPPALELVVDPPVPTVDDPGRPFEPDTPEPEPAPDPDEEYAEIVEPDGADLSRHPLLLRTLAALRSAGFDDEMRHQLAHRVSQGRTESSKDLTDEELRRVLVVADGVTSGEMTAAIRSGRLTIVRNTDKEHTA